MNGGGWATMRERVGNGAQGSADRTETRDRACGSRGLSAYVNSGDIAVLDTSASMSAPATAVRLTLLIRRNSGARVGFLRANASNGWLAEGLVAIFSVSTYATRARKSVSAHRNP